MINNQSTHDNDQTAENANNTRTEVDIIADWSLIEADFLREYNILLIDKIFTMSWRTFCVLLGGLSRNAVYITTKQNEKKKPKVVDGSSDEAENLVKNFFA